MLPRDGSVHWPGRKRSWPTGGQRSDSGSSCSPILASNWPYGGPRPGTLAYISPAAWNHNLPQNNIDICCRGDAPSNWRYTATRRTRRAHSPSALLQLESPQDDADICCRGLIGLALILLLLEISLRMELAKEGSDAAKGVIPAPSASPQRLEFGGALPSQPITPTSLQSVDQLGAPGAAPTSDYAQTFGQAFREPVPLPRPRKLRWGGTSVLTIRTFVAFLNPSRRTKSTRVHAVALCRTSRRKLDVPR